MSDEKKDVQETSSKVTYDGGIEKSEFDTLSHMISVISRFEKIRERLYLNLSVAEIVDTYSRTTFPIKDKNPLKVSKPICVCMQKVCQCIYSLPRDKLDSSDSISLIVSGSVEACDKYVKSFNTLRQQNIDKYHKILRLKNKEDSAFQLISISYSEMFQNCPYIPIASWEYAIFVDRVFQNIMKIFHRDIGYQAYRWICSMFRTYNFCNGQSLQVEPYFTPTWDLFGRADEVCENKINILRFTNNRDYRYYSGAVGRTSASKIDYGFIREVVDAFVDDSKVIHDRKIILQVASPDGQWVQDGKKRFVRYSDIQIGLAVKGKKKLGELPTHSAAREAFEEIGLELNRPELAQIRYVSEWGRISLFKLDITHLNKEPVNPF
jgi:hypothetical protein